MRRTAVASITTPTPTPPQKGEGKEAWPFEGLTPLKYGVILADCPWKTDMRSDKGYEKSPEKHYETMSEAELCSLPVGHLASRNCVLILWSRWINLEEALRVGKAWGFLYKTGGAWQKRTITGKKTFGTGYIYRNSTEPYLLFTMGNPSYKSKSIRDSITTEEEIDPVLSFPSDIDSLRREHSRKPPEMRANIDLLFPHEFGCELFAREPWAGRDVWGKEKNKFAEFAFKPPEAGE